MPVIHIEPPTIEEIREYKRQKQEEFLKSFSDEEKIKKMKPKTIAQIGRIKIGICPICSRCLVETDSFCDECFQRIDWSDTT
ncbi:hypothetical protein AALB52_04720 [Lachnospiraceae bacterium 38-14]